MIRVVPPSRPLRPAERFGLDVLIDASRLLPVDDPQADVVRLVLLDRAGPADDLPGFVTGRGTLEHAEGEVRISRAALWHVAEIAGAAAEQRATARDRHGRVPSTENPLVRLSRSREPVVSRWAAALRTAVIAVAGRRMIRCVAPWPDGRRWAAAFTHDLDVVAGWPVFTTLRLVELLRHAEFGRAAAVVAAAARGAVGRAPVWAGVQGVLDAEAAHAIRSTWFILAGTPGIGTWSAGDVTYAVESRATRRILDALAARGHEIGVHGTFATRDGAAHFTAERRRLAAAAGGTPVGVRQHFLKMRPGTTQLAMREAGFSYDATFGFPDRNGFRLGVADVVPAWDAASDTAPSLTEVPLHWMDRAQSKYQHVEDPGAWIADAEELAGAARAVDGLWVGLWHPNLTPALGFPGAPAAYARLLSALLERPDRPHVAPLAELVAWRGARRNARARRVAEQGTVEFAGGSVPLEDPSGAARG
ncbi:MAG TPA: hypothetical protein VI160_08325 [Gemmatimonadales bacterium]